MLTDLYQFHCRALQQPRSLRLSLTFAQDDLVSGVIGRFHCHSLHTGLSLSLHSLTTITIIVIVSSCRNSKWIWHYCTLITTPQQLGLCMRVHYSETASTGKHLLCAHMELAVIQQATRAEPQRSTGSNRPDAKQRQVQRFASVWTNQTEGLAGSERAVTLLTFSTHTFLTQHISVQSQWSFRPCCSKT